MRGRGIEIDFDTRSEVFCREVLQKLRTVQEENSDLLRDFALRLDQAATKAGLSQADISSRLGFKDSGSGRVNNWFKGRNLPRSAERPKLATMLNVRAEWLFFGEGEPQQYSDDPQINDAVTHHGIPVRSIPVISWAHAGAAENYEEMPKHFHGSISTMSRDRRAFALTIEGDSMEPKFLSGDRVVLEPSGSPINGKPVVAKFVDDAVQLRIFFRMPSGKIRLSPLNQVYPTIEHNPSEFAWIFPVVELNRSMF